VIVHAIGEWVPGVRGQCPKEDDMDRCPVEQARRIGRRRLGLMMSLCLTGGPLIAGCAHLGPAEKQALMEANQLYGRGDLSGACVRLDRLVAEHDGAMEIGEVYYLRGLCRAKARQYGPAAKDFRAAVDKSRRDDLTLMAEVSLASLAYQRNDWDQAVDYYERVLPQLAPKPPKDEILYMAGLAMQRVGKWREATLCFSEILNRFRDRPIASEARRKAVWPHPYFAIQLGAFRDSANAAKAVREWRNKNLDATQESLPAQGQALWVVMAGRYRTYGEALDALQQMRKLQSGAFIIP
jgi:outer membrane protein assembly factor BamD (BamD/ComL family)